MLEVKWSCIAASLFTVILFSNVANAGAVADLEREPEYLVVIENDYLAVEKYCLGILVAPMSVVTPSGCIVIKGPHVKVLSNGGVTSIPVTSSTTITSESEVDQENYISLLKLAYLPDGKKAVKLSNKKPMNTTIPKQDWRCVFLSRNRNTQKLHYHQRAVKLKQPSSQHFQFTVTPVDSGESLTAPHSMIRGSALFDEQGHLLGLTFTDAGMTTSVIHEYYFTAVGVDFYTFLPDPK